jgi:hypothetical protein
MLTSLDGIAYPTALRWLLAQGFNGFTPWHIVSEDHARAIRGGFQYETATNFHTIRDILPFAYRQDMDDVAGFVIEKGVVTAKVVTVHLTYRRNGPEIEGYPGMLIHDSFWSWMKECIDDTAEWCDDEELADLLVKDS